MIEEEAALRIIQLALRSLERMRRYRGHFFNWYALNDLRVLEPEFPEKCPVLRSRYGKALDIDCIGNDRYTRRTDSSCDDVAPEAFADGLRTFMP